MKEELPEFLQKVIERYPEIWEKYGELSQTIGSVQGLDERSQKLVKLGIAIGAARQGAVHSHTRKCKRAGFSNAELSHTALLAITTIGWSGAIAALSWITDELQETCRPVSYDSDRLLALESPVVASGHPLT